MCVLASAVGHELALAALGTSELSVSWVLAVSMHSLHRRQCRLSAIKVRPLYSLVPNPRCRDVYLSIYRHSSQRREYLSSHYREVHRS